MRWLPLPGRGARGPGDLARFLAAARAAAPAGRRILVSITLEVEHIDPLAVLETIDEPGVWHQYVERPDEDLAVAAAEPVLEATFAGPGRFREARDWVRAATADALAVGGEGLPLGGPVAFATFAFLDDETDVPAARVVFPRWMVARRDGRSVAVANLTVAADDADAALEAQAQRVLRAHARFGSFEYAPPPPPGGPVPALVAAAEDDAVRFRAAVADALACLARGEFEKIVVARRKRFEAAGALRPLAILDRLRQRFPACHAFSCGFGPRSFIGATPEMLVELRGGRVVTEAIAGTAPRGAGASDDARQARALLASDKDRREHALVVESILRRLRQAGVTPDEPGRPRLLQLANVQHLRTPLAGTPPEGCHLLDLAAVLHPTPAVGGKPRAAALPHVRRLDGFDRGPYAAPLGWITPDGGGRLLVALRAGWIEERAATLFAGVGVVAGSDPERELAETEMKFRALADALV